MEEVFPWIKARYKSVVNSIAFVPAIILLLFLGLSWIMIFIDFSEAGKNLKTRVTWLRLQDASTARTIISSIASGIITLTVFSFSMVMIVLNQAASQMSNRVLDKLIGNRTQQCVLGFYIGTIVYALFLLSTIRDIDSGIYIPALSTYVLMAFTVFDIFLFTFFLHYITVSVKYETIIGRLYKDARRNLEKSCSKQNIHQEQEKNFVGLHIKAKRSGIYQGFDKESLLKICEKEDLYISFIYPAGSFILEGSSFLIVINRNELSKECEDQLHILTNIQNDETAENNFYYSFRQLKEVAIKALSPGINDPGTAILGLHALADLLIYRSYNFPALSINDSKEVKRIFVKEKTLEELVIEYIFPIWDYGKNDRSMREAFRMVLSQLKDQAKNDLINRFSDKIEDLNNGEIILQQQQ